jgi:hypothetical protein
LGAEISGEVEAAAERMTQAAIKSGDKVKLAIALARFNDFLIEVRVTPLLMLKSIGEAFNRFRVGAEGITP